MQAGFKEGGGDGVAVSVTDCYTQVCGFKPDRSRGFLGAKKILRTPSFGGEVKPAVPMLVDLLSHVSRFTHVKDPQA